MLKDPRNFLWLVPLAALVTFPFWKPFAADFLSPVRSETEFPAPSLTSSRALSISEMKGIQFEQSKNGAKEWLLTASRLYSTGSDSDMQLEDVEALFFGPAEGNEETHIKSLKAGYNAGTNKIHLQGDVVIQNNKGYEMRTDSLEYLAAENKIRTTSAVSINGSNIAVSGSRLLYDTLTGDYSIDGNVVCRIW
jgi:LPS export ABC transporter protein LptC